MSTNAYVKLKQILPPSPVLVGLVTEHHADDTSTVVLPTNEGAIDYAAGVSAGSTIRARGTTVAIGDKAFVRDGVIETRAPDEDAIEIVVGTVVAPVTPLAFDGPIADQDGTVGAAFSLDLAPYWTGGYGARSITLASGTLPAGLTLSGGVLSGTPTTEAVTSGLVFRATDTAGYWAESNAVAFDVTASAVRMLASDTSNTLWYSDDAGVNWTSTGKTFASSVKLVWAGTQWVAAESRVAIDNLWTSPDGITWTQRTGATSKGRVGLAWNGSILVSVAPGISSTGVETSPDGITWTSRDLALPGWTFTSNPSIVWQVDEFVLIYPVSQVQCCRSADGITWAVSIAPKTTSTSQPVTFSAARVGSLRSLLTQTSPNRHITTTNYATWTQVHLGAPATPSPEFCSATDGTLWALASTVGIYTTTDGTTYTLRFGSGVTIRGMVHRADGFFAGKGYSALASELYHSADGITWTTVRTLPFNYSGVLATS